MDNMEDKIIRLATDLAFYDLEAWWRENHSDLSEMTYIADDDSVKYSDEAQEYYDRKYEFIYRIINIHCGE